MGATVAGEILTKVNRVDLLNSLAGSDSSDLFGASDHAQEDIVVEGDDAKGSLCGRNRMEMGQVEGRFFREFDHASWS